MFSTNRLLLYSAHTVRLTVSKYIRVNNGRVQRGTSQLIGSIYQAI